ncbi:hypothetical protein F511_17226 [Dorcoceras hygrometricum]|uniref:FLZ-type domain-containing protein n=1 Tax=Dorcoceras hygrometricum TaxID=472368 RepID=A0A2Z7AVS8_9LAMI|nr:hypothetical protein F511_17226 [Dorcoceras hygrometricum]
MLSNRSRAVASKQTLMADQSNSLLSPTRTPTTPISSFLGSPRFFNGFLTKNLSDGEANVMSPTSILDPKVSSSFVNPFGYDTNLSNPPSKHEQEAIGLALVDSINEEKNNENGTFGKPLNRMVLFGSKLKVHIPSNNHLSSHPPAESPKSPADFGIKTRNSQCFSPFSGNPEKSFSRQLSLKEMELSEDYTCVITHGPNPKTTHIFDDCVVENCCVNDDDDDEITSDHHREMESGFEINVSSTPSPNFLSFCHTCREILEQGKDIYIYRGEKAFCSHECRCQEMIIDGVENPKLDDDF